MLDGEYNAIEAKEKCAPDEWEGLFQSKPWLEFLDTIQVRLALTRDEMEREEEVREVYRLQGDARTLRFVLTLPSLIDQEFKVLRGETDKEK